MEAEKEEYPCLRLFVYTGFMAMAATQDEVVWNNDGHILLFLLNKSELDILEVVCPDESEEAPCRLKGSCIVQHFVNLYGVECNIGVCPPEAEMEISWCIQGDPSELDLSQLWFVPINDEVFYAWMNQRKT